MILQYPERKLQSRIKLHQSIRVPRVEDRDHDPTLNHNGCMEVDTFLASFRPRASVSVVLRRFT
jgi:hypothetical protein